MGGLAVHPDSGEAAGRGPPVGRDPPAAARVGGKEGGSAGVEAAAEAAAGMLRTVKVTTVSGSRFIAPSLICHKNGSYIYSQQPERGKKMRW